MRGHLEQPQSRDEVPAVIRFVGPQRDPLGLGHWPDHLRCRRPFAVAVGGSEAGRPRGRGDSPSGCAPDSRAWPPDDRLCGRASLRVRRGRVGGGVAAPFAMEIYRGIPRVVRRRRRSALALEALETRPGVDQHAIDGEVFIGQQAALLGLGPARTRAKNARAISPPSTRSRVFVNTVASQIRSSMAKLTNQRNSRL